MLRDTLALFGLVLLVVALLVCSSAEASQITWVEDCDENGNNCAVIGYTGEWADPSAQPKAVPLTKGGRPVVSVAVEEPAEVAFTCPEIKAVWFNWVMPTPVICASPEIPWWEISDSLPRTPPHVPPTQQHHGEVPLPPTLWLLFLSAATLTLSLRRN